MVLKKLKKLNSSQLAARRSIGRVASFAVALFATALIAVPAHAQKTSSKKPLVLSPNAAKALNSKAESKAEESSTSAAIQPQTSPLMAGPGAAATSSLSLPDEARATLERRSMNSRLK